MSKVTAGYPDWGCLVDEKLKIAGMPWD